MREIVTVRIIAFIVVTALYRAGVEIEALELLAKLSILIVG